MFKLRSAEADPLMPRNEPSPEIQNYGTSMNKSSSEILYTQTPLYPAEQINNNEDGREGQDERFPPPREPGTKTSVLGTLVTFLTFTVFFALILLALRTGDDAKLPNLYPRPAPHHNLTYEQRVHKILRDTPLIDGHNDLAIQIRGIYQNKIHTDEFKDQFEKGGLKGDVDLPRLHTGMYGGAFWSAFVGCPANSSDYSDAQYGTAVAETLQQIDLIKRLQKMYPSKFSQAGSSVADMLRRFHARGVMFGPLSIEGLHQVQPSAAMSQLRLYYELGVRAATLTWNCHNAFADAALIMVNNKTVIAPYNRGGLTDAGRKIIREMNRLGMLPDLSHTSYWTQKALLTGATSRAPVIFTHSSAYALCPHPRNVRDDILELVRDTNSVVNVNFAPDFISCVDIGEGKIPKMYPPNNTIHQVARHIVYIGEKIGYDHVGLGSDFDGVGDLLPRGLEGVDKLPNLIKELLKMGVSDADAAKVAGGNVLRVWRAAEEVAHNMQRDGEQEEEDEVDDKYRWSD